LQLPTGACATHVVQSAAVWLRVDAQGEGYGLPPGRRASVRCRA